MDPDINPFPLEDFQRQLEMEEAIFETQEEILEEIRRRNEHPRKRISINQDHGAAHKRLMADYFDESCTFTDLQFRRRFRMKRPLFLRIVDSLSNYDDYFTQRRNSAGKLGLTPIQKCTAVMRMVAYGMSADACDEYVKIGESTALECTRNFCDGVIALFQDQYLRRPTAEDLQILLHVGQERGFPGMI